MSLVIRPDPAAPAGGHALLELPAGTLAETEVRVAVQESFGERWLGPDGWQRERHGFGPCPVQRTTHADRIRIGPEIVDRIEEYTPLRIVLGVVAHDVIWPDSVGPRAGAAAAGGIRPAGRSEPEEPAPPAPEPEAAPQSPPRPEDEATDPAPGGRRRRGWRMWWIVPPAILAAALAAGWWWLYAREGGDGADPEAAIRTTPGQAVSAQPGCSYEALRSVAGGFVVVERAIRRCGAGLAPDAALRLVEDAAAQGDPAALALFGALYDGAVEDARIERVIGLSFGDDPAKAAEYYARAVRAGAEGVRPRLGAVCARLRGAEGTLEKGAFDDFCG